MIRRIDTPAGMMPRHFSLDTPRCLLCYFDLLSLRIIDTVLLYGDTDLLRA